MDFSKLSDNELLQLKEQLTSKVTALNGRQLAFKIMANALYGAVANAGFRYYDLRIGEAVTLTG